MLMALCCVHNEREREREREFTWSVQEEDKLGLMEQALKLPALHHVIKTTELL